MDMSVRTGRYVFPAGLPTFEGFSFCFIVRRDLGVVTISLWFVAALRLDGVRVYFQLCYLRTAPPPFHFPGFVATSALDATLGSYVCLSYLRKSL